MLKRWLAMGILTAVVCAGCYVSHVSAQQQELAAQLIRLHVVASSDRQSDQEKKLLVRDAVLRQVTELTCDCPDAAAALTVLQGQLSALRCTAENVLRAQNDSAAVRVTLEPEWFDSRQYETFRLPAGRYTALRVAIGQGQGHNWWCVAFPALCLPATAEGFTDAAAASGLTRSQTELLTGDGQSIEIKFRTLEWLEELWRWLAG